MATGQDHDASTLELKIKRLQGPILVLGGSGFVGGALMRALLQVRSDVYGTTTRLPAWRLEGLPAHSVLMADLLIDSNLDRVLQTARPRTIFDCIAYGAYSFETDAALIYQTNFNLTARLLERLDRTTLACYVHAGSSSEYGDNAAGPAEDSLPAPNSDYAVSKVAAAHFLRYQGKKTRLPCVNLRLYSVYGPLEDSSRLIPTVIRHGLAGGYPELVNPAISRDFVFIADVCEAFVDAALNLTETDYGESFNIGTGVKTTIGAVAALARDQFAIESPPQFTMPERRWDVTDWYARIDRAQARLGWTPRTAFADGFAQTVGWYRSLPDQELYRRSSKLYGLDVKHSVSAVVACGDARDRITEAYDRLKRVLTRLDLDHEIIFVIDGGQSGQEETVRALSRNDRRVLGISHSRRFGVQASFRSGMEVASKNGCLLLTAALDDPPELLEQFVAHWREGYDVVYGQRDRASTPLGLALARRALQHIFDVFSFVSLPRDASEFGLMDRQVVQAMLQFPERALFLQGVRAFAGFRQIGVVYRPESRPAPEGLAEKLRRAKHGILAFSNAPLTLLSLGGLGLLAVSMVLGVAQILVRLRYPERAASGITTVLLVILFFGAVNVLAVALVGEYVGRIFEEVKRRPHFIRRTFVKEGEIRRAADNLVTKEG